MARKGDPFFWAILDEYLEEWLEDEEACKLSYGSTHSDVVKRLGSKLDSLLTDISDFEPPSFAKVDSKELMKSLVLLSAGVNLEVQNPRISWGHFPKDGMARFIERFGGADVAKDGLYVSDALIMRNREEAIAAVRYARNRIVRTKNSGYREHLANMLSKPLRDKVRSYIDGLLNCRTGDKCRFCGYVVFADVFINVNIPFRLAIAAVYRSDNGRFVVLGGREAKYVQKAFPNAEIRAIEHIPNGKQAVEFQKSLPFDIMAAAVQGGQVVAVMCGAPGLSKDRHDLFESVARALEDYREILPTKRKKKLVQPSLSLF